MFLVYKITNTINQKIYIGLTSSFLQVRWYKHIGAAKRKEDNSIFHKAISKYGECNFVVEELESNLTKNEAMEKEKYYIKFYNTYYLNGLGYNMTLGGENAIQNYGENNGMSKASNEQRFAAIHLLLTTNLTYLEICEQIGYYRESERAMRSFIGDLNTGHSFRQPSLDYPLRKDQFSTRAKGLKNANCLSEDVVLGVINELITTNKTMIEIGKEYNIHPRTVGRINNCKTYTNLHNFKVNIRKGE